MFDQDLLKQASLIIDKAYENKEDSLALKENTQIIDNTSLLGESEKHKVSVIDRQKRKTKLNRASKKALNGIIWSMILEKKY